MREDRGQGKSGFSLRIGITKMKIDLSCFHCSDFD